MTESAPGQSEQFAAYIISTMMGALKAIEDAMRDVATAGVHLGEEGRINDIASAYTGVLGRASINLRQFLLDNLDEIKIGFREADRENTTQVMRRDYLARIRSTEMICSVTELASHEERVEKIGVLKEAALLAQTIPARPKGE